MKKLVWIFLFFVVFLIVAAGIFYYMLGSIIATGVETVGPKATGGIVRLGHVNISLLNGVVGLRDLELGNPSGFSSKDAFTLGRVRVQVDMGTVTGNPIVIKDILIEGAKITWEGLSGDNLNKIMDNIKRFSHRNSSGGTKAKGPARKQESKKRIIIEDFLFRNGLVNIVLGGKEVASIRLPDIHLVDIGKKEDGISLEKAIERSYYEIMKSLEASIKENKKMLLKQISEYGENGKNLLEHAGQKMKSGGKTLENVLNAPKREKGLFENR